MKKYAILIGCEESQAIANALRELGHEAYSCDLQPCPGGHPEYHLQMDVIEAIMSRKWDAIILHPECKKIAVSGNSTYGVGMPKHAERLIAAAWTSELYRLATNQCKVVIMENPVGVLNSLYPWLPKPQYIHPWQYGHPEQKKTGLWKSIPLEFEPTDNVYEYMMTLPKKEREKNHYRSPGPERSKLRSKTYPGIAKGLAVQLVNYLNSQT